MIGARRKLTMVLAAALAVLSPAWAEELAGGDAPFEIVEISAEACAALAIYIPMGEADYKPGVAVDGSPVAPADIDGGYAIEPREFYTFPVKIEPLGRGNPRYSSDSSLEVATVTVDPTTGHVTVDGRTVSGADHALAEACRHHIEKSDD